MDLTNIATRVAATHEAGRRKKSRKKKKTVRSKKKRALTPDRLPEVDSDVLQAEPEYACHIELDITANFEGRVEKKALIQKIKAELLTAIKGSMTTVSRELNLSSRGVTVRPLRLECDVNDVIPV